MNNGLKVGSTVYIVTQRGQATKHHVTKIVKKTKSFYVGEREFCASTYQEVTHPKTYAYPSDVLSHKIVHKQLLAQAIQTVRGYSTERLAAFLGQHLAERMASTEAMLGAILSSISSDVDVDV